MVGLSTLLAVAATLATTSAHLVITYPGWRGDNLHANGTNEDGSIIPGSRGINWNETAQEYYYPYGMAWMYPCGGMPTSTNRTKWPVSGGGTVAFQPGWFTGHQFAFIYVNMGYGAEPKNMSHPMVPVFQLTGPTNGNYSGTMCLTQISLPAGFAPKVGDLATIQVVEAAQHGAALYSCVDIEFADDHDVEPVTPENCFNGTDSAHPNDGAIGANFVFTSKSLTSGAGRRAGATASVGSGAVLVGLAVALAGLI